MEVRMTTKTATDCTHPHMKVDSHNQGTCSICGAVLKYSWDGKQPPTIITPGISLTAGDPKELPINIKKAVAHLAKEHGVIILSNQTGIEMKIVRAWVGAYCRGPKADKPKHQLKERKKPGPKPKAKPETHHIVDIAIPVPDAVGTSKLVDFEYAIAERTKPALAQVKRQRGRYRVYRY